MGAASPGVESVSVDAVVVTGASTGIGRACALRLVERGLRVYAGVRKEADAAALKGLARGDLRPLQLDVTDAASIEAAAKTVDAELGARGLLGLVNNAGIAVAAPLEFVELDELRRQLEVNVVGQMAVTQAFLPAIRRRTGRIVFVGSSSGYNSTPLTGPYCASKFAIEGVADVLRQELRAWDIEVALVEPGAIQTPIWEKSQAEADRTLARLPERARTLYGFMVEPMRAAVVDRSRAAIPPEKVANAVLHALTARRPRTRYRVGVDATVEYVLARWLPDRWHDAAIARFLKLPRRGPRAD